MLKKWRSFVTTALFLGIFLWSHSANAHRLSDLMDDMGRALGSIGSVTPYKPRFSQADHERWAASLIENAPDLYLRQRSQRVLNVNSYAPPTSKQASNGMINQWERTAIKRAAEEGEMGFYSQVAIPLKGVTIGTCRKNVSENQYDCSLKKVDQVCLNDIGYVPTGIFALSCSVSVGMGSQSSRLGHFFKRTDGLWYGF
jgi:hypothetical protein